MITEDKFFKLLRAKAILRCSTWDEFADRICEIVEKLDEIVKPKER